MSIYLTFLTSNTNNHFKCHISKSPHLNTSPLVFEVPGYQQTNQFHPELLQPKIPREIAVQDFRRTNHNRIIQTKHMKYMNQSNYKEFSDIKISSTHVTKQTRKYLYIPIYKIIHHLYVYIYIQYICVLKSIVRFT